MKSREYMLKVANEIIGDSMISSQQFIETGWNSIILVINGVTALKFPRDIRSSGKLEYERKIISLLDGFPFNVPHYEIVEIENDTVGIYRFIEGMPLSSIMDLGGNLLSDFSRYFEYTFSFDPLKMERAGIMVVDAEGWIEKEVKILEEFRRSIGKHVNQESLEDLSERIKDMSHSLIPEDIGLIHGDFYRGNVLVNPDCSGISGVIDWGESGSGDLAFDLASLSVDFSEDVIIRLIPHGFSARSRKYLERMRIYKSIEPLYTLFYLNRFGKDAEIKKLSGEFNRRMQGDEFH